MKKIIFIIGLLLFCLFLINVEAGGCTSNEQCTSNEYCIDWKCESKDMSNPTVVSTNTPQNYSSGLTFIVWIGIAIFALLIVIIYLLLRRRKK